MGPRLWTLCALGGFVLAGACFVELDPPATSTAGDGGSDAPSELDAGCDGGQAISRVQAAHVSTLNGSSDHIAVTLEAAQNAGDFLAVGVNYLGCAPVTGLADKVGNGYERFIAPDALGDAGALETWGAKNVAAAPASANTVTVTFGGVCPKMNLKVVEYRGVDPVAPVDGTASTHGSGAAPAAHLSVPASELLFAHTADSYVAMGPGEGWTQIFMDDWKTIAEERLAPGPGTYDVTFRPSSDEGWVIQAIGLRCR